MFPYSFLSCYVSGHLSNQNTIPKCVLKLVVKLCESVLKLCELTGTGLCWVSIESKTSPLSKQVIILKLHSGGYGWLLEEVYSGLPLSLDP